MTRPRPRTRWEDDFRAGLAGWGEMWRLAPVVAAIRAEAKAEALPVVEHKGPHDTDRSMFLGAARNLERGYPLGGGNLTRAVVALIRREVNRAALLDGGDQ